MVSVCCVFIANNLNFPFNVKNFFPPPNPPKDSPPSQNEMQDLPLGAVQQDRGNKT